MNYGSKDGGDENGRVEKGARKFMGEEGKERRRYVVFTIGIKLEDKKRKLEKWRGLLTGSYLQVGDDPTSKGVGKGKGENTTAGLLLFFL
jgi:hypothetical protein